MMICVIWIICVSVIMDLILRIIRYLICPYLLLFAHLLNSFIKSYLRILMFVWWILLPLIDCPIGFTLTAMILILVITFTAGKFLPWRMEAAKPVPGAKALSA